VLKELLKKRREALAICRECLSADYSPDITSDIPSFV